MTYDGNMEGRHWAVGNTRLWWARRGLALLRIWHHSLDPLDYGSGFDTFEDFKKTRTSLENDIEQQEAYVDELRGTPRGEQVIFDLSEVLSWYDPLAE